MKRKTILWRFVCSRDTYANSCFWGLMNALGIQLGCQRQKIFDGYFRCTSIFQARHRQRLPFLFFLHLYCCIGADVKMPAIATYLTRHIPDNDQSAFRFKGDSIAPFHSSSVFANNTIHNIRFYFFVLKSACQMASSGQYAVITIHRLFITSSATTTCSAFCPPSRPTNPKIRQLGYGLSFGY